jgi:hypothetical protein
MLLLLLLLRTRLIIVPLLISHTGLPLSLSRNTWRLPTARSYRLPHPHGTAAGSCLQDNHRTVRSCEDPRRCFSRRAGTWIKRRALCWAHGHSIKQYYFRETALERRVRTGARRRALSCTVALVGCCGRFSKTSTVSSPASAVIAPFAAQRRTSKNGSASSVGAPSCQEHTRFPNHGAIAVVGPASKTVSWIKK